MRRFPLRLSGQGHFGIVSHAVRLDVGFIDDVDSVLDRKARTNADRWDSGWFEPR